MHKKITGVNLSAMPFVSSCDSTRANMVTKQFSQSLTHPNCEIPYVNSDEWRSLRDTSTLGVHMAPEKGEVLFNNNDIIMMQYASGRHEIKRIPPVKTTSSIFASSLRHTLKAGDCFNAGDIIYEYDNFFNGIPSNGYNTNVAYMPFFGYNHEDALVISEDFSERARHRYCETVVVPIFEYTILQKLYDNTIQYIPDIGEQINYNVVCASLLPIESKKCELDTVSIKNKVVSMLSSMNISELINLKLLNNPNFISEQIKTDVVNGTVSGIKIHKLKKDVNLIDGELQQKINMLFNRYGATFIAPAYNAISKIVGPDLAKKIMRKYYIYGDRDKIRHDIYIKDLVYLIEIEITKEETVHLGDKLSNRHAAKGVVSLILPSELRPYGEFTKDPVDIVYNPFGVFSRMNLSQLLEGVVSKPTKYYDKCIRERPDKMCDYIELLNRNVLRFLGNDEYCNNVTKLVEMCRNDKNVFDDVLNDIQKTNLFCEVPSFAKIDLRKLLKCAYPHVNENLVIKKEMIDYMKERTDCFKDLVVTEDIKIPNIYVAPIYIQKLHKIADKLVSVRSLGPTKLLTNQPLKGRARGGGSRIGQMEIEAIIANGCVNSLREFFTIKNDWPQIEKEKMISSLVSEGSYVLPDEPEESVSKTKVLVDTIIDFLKK